MLNKMSQKIHRSIVEGLVFALSETFIQNRKSDKVLAGLFKQNKKWGARDRGFIAENTYDIVRWWRSITDAAGLDYKHIKPYQIWFTVKAWLDLNNYDIPGWKEWEKFDIQKFRIKYLAENKPNVLRYSIPDWLDSIGAEQLGIEKWETELSVINDSAPVTIRANLFKNDVPALMKILAEEGVETSLVEGVPHALKITKRQNIFITQAFKDGRFELQDPGSQLIAQYLDVQPGQRVIDACAGAGGKSLYLSNLMQNKGQLISLDVEQWKLDELKKRARRNGAHNIETRLIESKTIKRLKESADRVLLDVPCTGLGTLRRNPDAKWKLSLSFLEEVTQLQASILMNYSSMVKPGGKMVYATCSILPSENELQVIKFLETNTAWTLLKESHTDTSKTGFDGFYMALLSKNS
jgi:16S rRNA (cytosine967-C5)-methyltransferase